MIAQLNTDLQQSLRKVINLGSLPQTAVAKGAGISTTVVSQFLNSTVENILYKGDMEKVQKKLQQYVERETQRIMAPQPPPYLELGNSTAISEVLKLSHIERVMCVIVGPPGTGKSFSINQYAREVGDVIYVTANPSWRTKALVASICTPLGIQTAGPSYQLVERVIETLSGTGKIVVIDEAQSLSYESLEVIRSIHDRAGIGVVLSGMQRLHDNMIGRGRGLFAHLYSRVSRCLVLSHEIDTEDVARIVRAVFPEASATEVRLFEQICNQAGRLRTLVQMLCHLRRTANMSRTGLNIEMIREVKTTLMVA